MNYSEFIEDVCQPSRITGHPIGNKLNALSWQTEAPLRMLLNNLNAEVAENPDELIVYGGTGQAARNPEAVKEIIRCLLTLKEDQSLLIQSGKPVGIIRSHPEAPRVLIANSNLVPAWANWEYFKQLKERGLIMYGQMTAGSWIYIGSQGILQGTYETFAECGRKYFNGKTARKTAGIGRTGRYGRRPATGCHHGRIYFSGCGCGSRKDQKKAHTKVYRQNDRHPMTKQKTDYRESMEQRKAIIGRTGRKYWRCSGRNAARRTSSPMCLPIRPRHTIR